MTSGLTGNVGISAQNFTGFDQFRNWTGTDGHFDTTPLGKKRMRWNNFQVTRGYRKRSSNQWTCIKVVDGSTYSFACNIRFLMGTSSPVIPNSLVLKAQSKLADTIKGHNFNLAVNAAQSKQLVEMVVGNLGKLGRAILALKHGNFANAARQLGAQPRTTRLKSTDISGRWLELQYGWLPSLSDTYEAAKAYEVLTAKERKTVFHAGAKQDVMVECSTSPGTYSARMKVRQGVHITAELYEVLPATRSLGLMDPLSVVWEIIPYSFVVDWFVPIGTYLSALAVLPSLTGRFCTTRSNVYAGMEPPVVLVPIPGTFGGFNCASATYNGVDEARGVYSDRVVTSGLTVARPQFDSSGLHGKRIANALALAYQRFRK